MQKTIHKRLFVIAGTIFLVTGITGIFVPVLPTTPFLLLAAACYARGSERLYRWLLHNRIFGSYIRNYIEGKGMPLTVKLITILILWTGILLTVFLGVEHMAIRIALVVIATGVTVHISLIGVKIRGDKR